MKKRLPGINLFKTLFFLSNKNTGNGFYQFPLLFL